ncbi:DUF2321 domain-containing protein [Staphylococcus saprophyticus]|uniref:DUF2321 domain-containing protein n=1 Tax=Staphylococcus nepalensis TaxID=214473 RepID=UPI0029796386|nr:DUF2321 domain-containing protein [Staphylococcus saprophyticus]
MENEQYPQICKKGHLDKITDIFTNPRRPFCAQCGEPVLSQCPNCRHYITTLISDDNKVPNYCFSCGNAFPWTQNLIDNAIELIALDTNLNENDKTIIKDAIPHLVVESFETPLAQGKTRQVISKMSPWVIDLFKQLSIKYMSDKIYNGMFN